MWAALLVIAAGAWAQRAAFAAQARYQAIWVDAFHEGFKTREQTRHLIEWAHDHHINALFVEVRKEGDAYYRSTLEPPAADISPPGYDPLADLIDQAHDTRSGRPRIEIHAWLIIYRVATGKPLPRTHVARRHPEWLSQTYGGRRDENGHVFLDPGVPGVIDHTAKVVAELVSRYDLDGVHFDRIRYPSQEWGYNAAAVARFRRIAHRLRRPKPEDSAWSQFRREQVSAMLRRLYIVAKSRRPTVKVSAATVAFDDCESDFRQSRSFSDVFQDWQSWVREGWLDLNCLMVYKRDWVAEQAMQYRQWLDFLANNRGLSLPVVGQGSFLNSPSGSLRQISLALQHPTISGVCLFSYAQKAREGDRGDQLTEILRRRYFHRGVPTPKLLPPARLGYGWVGGNVVSRSHDYVQVDLSTNPPRSTRTDGSGFFAFNRLPVGEYRISVSLGRRRKATKAVRVAAGKVTWVQISP